jgi:DNA-binding HxlR family transcriptional regulator
MQSSGGKLRAEMLQNTYEGQSCSLARTLEVVGERWTMLVMRDALLGVRRFEDFQRGLGVARNILAARLQRLCDLGVLERRQYQDRPIRREYRLTAAGRDLWIALDALRGWGDRHLAPDGPRLAVEHRGCGGTAEHHVVCERCHQDVGLRDISVRPGVGAELDHLPFSLARLMQLSPAGQ